jgi:hypothetical protein
MWRRWVVAALVLGVLVGCGGQQLGANQSSDRPVPSSDRPVPDPGDTTPDVNGPPSTVGSSSSTPNLYKVRVSVKGTETPGVVTSNLGDISCPRFCFSRYPSGASVTLMARPEAAGKVFNRWGGACSSQGWACRLNVDESMDVTAWYA